MNTDRHQLFQLEPHKTEGQKAKVERKKKNKKNAERESEKVRANR